MLVLSQLSRAPRDPPRRSSAAVERSPANPAPSSRTPIWWRSFSREEVYKPDREDLRGMAELLLAKTAQRTHRTPELVFLKEFTKFENRTNDLGGDDSLPE